MATSKYLKRQPEKKNNVTYKVTPTRPISVLKDSRAALSRTIMPDISASVIDRFLNKTDPVSHTLVVTKLGKWPTVIGAS